MAITINGTGSITGLTAGGLPDGSIVAGDLASSLDLTGKTVTLPSGTGGKILQVVQTVKTDTFSTTSTTFTDITGMSVSITPSSTSSKILVFVYLNDSNCNNFTMHSLLRGSTEIFLGDAAGSRARVTAGAMTDSNRLRTTNYHFLDSPSTTSATTYKCQMRVNTSETGYINRASSDTNNYPYHRSASAITVMEVAG